MFLTYYVLISARSPGYCVIKEECPPGVYWRRDCSQEVPGSSRPQGKGFLGLCGHTLFSHRPLQGILQGIHISFRHFQKENVSILTIQWELSFYMLCHMYGCFIAYNRTLDSINNYYREKTVLAHLLIN